ncbi:MAG: signal peptidase I [Treponema sp.]|nr:signal peptidase I [Treponema sp.]
MKQSVYEYSYEMKEKRRKRTIRRIAVVLCIGLVLTVAMDFLLFPVFVRSDSMESGISANSAVFVTPLDKSPKRGQVFYISRSDGQTFSTAAKIRNALFRLFTAQQFSPFEYSDSTTGTESIRRVLALPGDSIYMKDYILYIKPEGSEHFLSEFELAEKPYDIHIYDVPENWDSIGSSDSMEERKLSKDEYFVLADNRIHAVDSRHFGPVKGERFLGRVILEYFPFRKFRVF